MAKSLLFWTFIALDGAALGLMFLLGLAAAQPSHTSPLAVVGFFALPALLLLALVAVFLRAPWPAARFAAMVVAAAPVVLVLGGAVVSNGVASLMGEHAGVGGRADPQVQQQLIAAIEQGDAAAASRIAQAQLPRIDDAAALVAAIAQIERSEYAPERVEVLRALLRAGVQPLSGGTPSTPLEAAIRASRRIGAEPVRLLLAAGADPNHAQSTGPVWFAALSRGVDADVLPLLLDHGADLRAVDMAGGPAMKWALFHRNWGAAVLLVERGASWQELQLDHGATVQRLVADSLRAQPGDAQLQRLDRLLRTGAAASSAVPRSS